MLGVDSKSDFQVLNETAVRNNASIPIPEFASLETGGYRATINLIGYLGRNYAAQGTGRSKKLAKHDAAKEILQQIGISRSQAMPSPKQSNEPVTSEIREHFASDTSSFLPVVLANERNINVEFQKFCDNNFLKMQEHVVFLETPYGNGEDIINFVECELQGYKTSGAAKKKVDAKKIAILKQLNHWNPDKHIQGREVLGFPIQNRNSSRSDAAGPSSAIYQSRRSSVEYNGNFGASINSTEHSDFIGSNSSAPLEATNPSGNNIAELTNTNGESLDLASLLDFKLKISQDPDITVVESKISFYKSKKLGNPNSSKVHKGYFEDKPAAVKLIEPDRFHNNEIREIHILKNIDHINLVRYYASEKKENHTYVAMQFADLGTLEEYLKKQPSPSVELRKQFLLDIGKGLKYLHIKENIVHRDIKPTNVLIFSNLHNKTNSPSNLNPTEIVAKLADFGISKQLKSSRNCSTTRVGGTDGWMPPEVFEAFYEDGEDSYKVKMSTDIFAYGMLMFYGMCGSHPFSPNNSLFKAQTNICDKEEPYWQKIGENSNYGDYNFFCLKYLFGVMLLKDPEERENKCNINTVVNEKYSHPFFWSSTTCLEFIRTLASELKSSTSSLHRKSLHEAYWGTYQNLGSWGSRISSELRQFITSPRNEKIKKYDFDRVDKLIEFIRDKYEHPEMLKREEFSSNLFGPNFENYMDYFIEKFPELVIFLYDFFKDSDLLVYGSKLATFYQ